jgi:indole-3-glycerol phosphate synthase
VTPTSGSVLAEILAHKRSELADRQRRVPQGELRHRAERASPALDFTAALAPRAPERVRLIAEVKKASPSAGVLNAGLDPVAQARTYADAGAAAISVLTDEKYFRGHLDDLVHVRAAVTVPLLRKEFIVDEYQLWESRAAGADAVLLIVAALDRASLRDLVQAAKGVGLATLVEVHDAPELDVALSVDAPVIGVNNRDLRTLTTSLAPSLAVLPLVPPGRVAVSESGISSRADVERVVAAGAHAILVGEALVRAGDVAAKVRELVTA